MTESVYKLSFFLPPQKWISILRISFNVPKVSITRFAILYPYYKEKPGIIKSVYNPFFSDYRPICYCPISHLTALSKLLLFIICTTKKNPEWQNLHITPFLSDHWPSCYYYSYFKDKLVSNLTWTFVCAANCLYFLFGWNNLLVAFFFAYNSGTFTVEPGPVTKKGESLRTFLHLLFYPDQSLSLSLNLISSLYAQQVKMQQCANDHLAWQFIKFNKAQMKKVNKWVRNRQAGNKQELKREIRNGQI